MTLAMSKEKREEFLSQTHVAVISVAEDGRGPLTIPVWYRYEPGGDVFFTTGGSSRKAKLLRRAGRMSLCVQTETPPYVYVSVEGPVTVGDAPDFERDVRSVAVRYLGPEIGAAYLRATTEEQQNAVLVRLRPERWFSVDYNQMTERISAALS